MTFRTKLFGVAATGVLAISLAAAACGDDGSSSSSSGGSGDEKYVAVMCTAFKDFGDGVGKAVAGAGAAKSEDDSAKLLVAPLEKLAAALGKANPPGDVKKAHEQIITQIKEVAADVKKNGAKSTKLNDLDSPKLSAAAEARLNALADKNKECSDSGFSFGSE